MCNLVQGDVTLTGCTRLCERPISDLVEALSLNGCEFEFLEKKNHIPFKVKGKGVEGGEMLLAANVSSQFVSSVLITCVFSS
jgi:5-enolpyruvylshikimate-3-phosphate synthase